MIKKIIVLLSIAFAIVIGVGTISANTTTVKVEVISRNIEKHTINVKTDDSNADKFTLKKVSAAQMAVADKGSIIKVRYDDNFNVSAIEKVGTKSHDHSHSHSHSDDVKAILAFLVMCMIILMIAYFVM